MTNPTPHGQVPEALRLAHIFDNPLPPEWPDMVAAAAELRRQHARIAELGSELEAVGAGGVQALSAAQAIGDELRDTLVAVSAAIAERDDRAAQKMIREILAASPTPPAEQQATTTEAALGGVYAELPDPGHRGPVGTGSYFDSFTRDQMRDFADRTHAARLRCKSEQARLATLWGYVRADATTKQAAPKAAPAAVEWPSDSEIDALVTSIGPTEGIRKDSRDLSMSKLRMLVRRALATWGQVKEAPPAQGDALSDAVRVPLDKLHADAAYLIGRLREGSMPYARAIEIIRERIDAAKAAIRARAAQGDALDAARLDWLLLRISGAEFRRIGVHYSGNASRADVDAARKQGANHD